MKKHWLGTLVLCLAACGEDEGRTNNQDSNNTNNIATNNAMTNNATTTNNSTATNNNNVVEVNNVTRPFDVDVWEIEPNNTERGALTFEAGQSIGGTIAPPRAEVLDTDFFKVRLEAGTIFEIDFVEVAGGLEPAAWLRSVDGRWGGVGITDRLQTRQFFIPETGEYTLEIGDYRFDEGGGEESHYHLKTRVVQPTPTPATLGSFPVTLQDGKVAVYEVDLSMVRDSANLHVETIGHRLGAEDYIQGQLYVYSPDDGEWSWARLLETRSYFMGQSWDVYLSAPVKAGKVWVVVDSLQAQFNATSKLSMRLGDDDAMSPQMLAAAPLTDTMWSVADGVADKDFFIVDAPIGSQVRVEVRSQGVQAVVSAGPVQSWCLYTPNGCERVDELELFARSTPEFDGAEWVSGVEVQSPGRPVVITVEDLRNATGQVVDGEALTYIIERTYVPVEPVVIGGNESLMTTVETGQTNWFETTVAPMSVMAVDVTAPDLSPVCFVDSKPKTITGEDAYDGSLLIINDNVSERAVEFSARDLSFRRMEAEVRTWTVGLGMPGAIVNETEPNPRAMPQAITAPSRVSARLSSVDPTDPEWDAYAFEAEVGDAILLQTMAGTMEPSADTIIFLYGPDGALVAGNDDYQHGDSGFSAILHEVTQSGTYTVEVSPFCYPGFCGLGYYTLDVRKGVR